MKRALVTFALVLITVVSLRNQALSYTVVTDPLLPDYAIAVNNLETWYGTYDVTWEYGTYAEVFSDGLQFPWWESEYVFQDLVNALNATLTVYNDHLWGVGDVGSWFTPYFCMPTYPPYEGNIWTHYAYTENGAHEFYWLNYQIEDIDLQWAVFTPSAVPETVPVPPTLFLLGSGLIGLVGGRRKGFIKSKLNI